MASRRSNKRKSQVTKNNYLDDILTEDEQKEEKKEDLLVAEEPVSTYNSSKKVKLQLKISARVISFGSETGKRYEWERAGAVVEVDEEDVTELLSKRLGDKACCGGDSDNLKLFIQVE